MNRVLRRPMFRLGGSAEGITSGLDGPNINASRKGYAFGSTGPQREYLEEKENVIEEQTIPNDLESRIMDDVTMREKLYDKYGVGPEKEAMAPGSLSSLLTNFSLNLAAQPGGNLMGAIGKAGAPALEKFQAARMSERLSKGKRKREMIDEAVRGQYGLEEERIAAQGAIDEAMVKAQGKGEKAFQFQAQFKQITDTRQKIRDLQKEVDAGNDPDGSKAAKIGDLNEALTDLVGIDPILEAIYGSEWMSEQIDDITDNFEAEEGRQPTIDEVLKIIKSKGKKDGGRIGYQMGGDVIEEEVSETIDTGPAQTQDLTYMELRSRLPREIGNDIVQLLAASKQALMDFANIQTQQDVDNFNQSYNVDLVLPQEG
jgi:hypothetical protein